jgi:serine/threonine protein kinase
MKQIDDIILIKKIGRGCFGTIYLSQKKGKKEFFATKEIDRLMAEQPEQKKYLTNEIMILKILKNHPNIVKFKDTRITKNYYYIIMEYVYGYDLTKCFDIYKQKNGRPFSEEVVQYLMRQIVSALKYMHHNNIIHRDLSFNNIMVHFNNPNDKKNLDIMKGTVKIIDFGISAILKNGMQYSGVGAPLYMDPVILKKHCKRKDSNLLGYKKEVDIWSLGTICYQMIIGHPTFDSDSLDELMKKVENGTYTLPTNLSKEIVSFLNGMLQYDPKKRLNIDQLEKHPFLTKSLYQFTKIDLSKVNNNIKNNKLKMNTKNNRTIWAIFNEEDEKKLLSIDSNNNYIEKESPIKEESVYDHKKMPLNENKIINNNINFSGFKPTNFGVYNNFLQGKNIYGQSMFPDDNDNNGKGNEPIRGNENPWVKNLNLNFPTFELPINNNNFIVKNDAFPQINNNENIFNNNPIIKSNINAEYNHYIPDDDNKNNRNNDCCCIL